MEKSEIYETLSEAYFSDNPHEKEVIDHLPMLLREASLVADVGASLGQYTRIMSRSLCGGEVHAIEADPIRVEQLERNCEEWSQESTNQISVHHMALTDRTGKVPYFVTNSNVSGGLAMHNAPRPVEWEEITVSASTLDDLFPDRVPDFVKVDVEGAELSVLRGAKRILTNGNTTFLVELHDWPTGSSQSVEVRRLLGESGYLSATFFGQPIFVKSRSLWLKLKLMEMRDLGRLRPRLRTGLGKLRQRLGGRRGTNR